MTWKRRGYARFGIQPFKKLRCRVCRAFIRWILSTESFPDSTCSSKCAGILRRAAQ